MEAFEFDLEDVFDEEADDLGLRLAPFDLSTAL
jgi:hypothetical protein